MLDYKYWHYETVKEPGAYTIHDTENTQLSKIPKEWFIEA